MPLQEQGQPNRLHVQARAEEPTQFVVLKVPSFSGRLFSVDGYTCVYGGGVV